MSRHKNRQNIWTYAIIRRHGRTKTIMAYSVNISVEAPIENQIQEITYDGQEIYQAYVDEFAVGREYGRAVSVNGIFVGRQMRLTRFTINLNSIARE